MSTAVIMAVLMSAPIGIYDGVIESETIPLTACEMRVAHLNFYRMHRLYWCEEVN